MAPIKDNIYKLVRMMDYVSEEQVVFVRSPLDVKTLIEILAAIQFKFEELINDGVTVEERHYAEFLQKYYGMEDVTEKYKEFNEDITMPSKRCWNMITNFKLYDYREGISLMVTLVELYQARESCCGPGYDELMKKHIPKDEEFERDIENLKPYFLEHNY